MTIKGIISSWKVTAAQPNRYSAQIKSQPQFTGIFRDAIEEMKTSR
jgi:hypothetical protein